LVSLEYALTAKMAPKSAALPAVANRGNWIVQCPDCNGAQLTASEDPRFMCVDCGNASVGVRWRPVVWPADHEEISDLLDQRPRELANTEPGETVAEIKQQNGVLDGATLIGGQSEAPAKASDWEGHTHDWQPVDRAGMQTCSECSLVLLAYVIKTSEAT
jgi:hypothetical protein